VRTIRCLGAQAARHPLGGPVLSPTTRILASLCALTLFATTALPGYADEPRPPGERPRLVPTSRGGRQEAPAPPQSTSPPVAPQPPPGLGTRIAERALAFVGSPYAWGGTSPVTGFDCSGFVQWVLGQFGIRPGRVVWAQYRVGTPVPAGQLQPGDVVFFANTYAAGLSHVGIYVGDRQFVDAGTERTGVRRASLDEPYWASRFVGARRLPG
jgi:cell wall-associated NlpC family hydrolase